MTHDITHCNNEGCPAKNRCKRYQVHLDNISEGHPFCSYLSLSDEQKERVQRLGSCLHFVNHQNSK